MHPGALRSLCHLNTNYQIRYYFSSENGGQVIYKYTCLGSKSAVCLWFQQIFLLPVTRIQYWNPLCTSRQTLASIGYSFSPSSRASLLRECASTFMCCIRVFVTLRSFPEGSPFLEGQEVELPKNWKLSFSSYLDSEMTRGFPCLKMRHVLAELTEYNPAEQ